LIIENKASKAGKGGEARILLLAARREDVDEHLSILKGAKLKPVALDISACALARLIGYSRTDTERNALIINAGELHTTLTMLWRDAILIERTILWGRENMVDSLMQRLKLDRDKAGRLLMRAGLHPRHAKETREEKERNKEKDKISETVYEIVSAQLEKLAREIEKVIQYVSSEMRGAAIDVIYLTGTAADISDLDTYIEKRTRISAKNINPLRTLQGGSNGTPEDSKGYGSICGVALGLAMRGYGNRNMQPDEE
jgi:type IV pilus assembly protein PilM